MGACGNSSALFLTAAVQNLPCLKLAEELGVVIANPWVSWFNAASLPAIMVGTMLLAVTLWICGVAQVFTSRGGGEVLTMEKRKAEH
ncbi:hypothetical protein Bca4012_083350 [Brassica carinata]